MDKIKADSEWWHIQMAMTFGTKEHFPGRVRVTTIPKPDGRKATVTERIHERIALGGIVFYEATTATLTTTYCNPDGLPVTGTVVFDVQSNAFGTRAAVVAVQKEVLLGDTVIQGSPRDQDASKTMLTAIIFQGVVNPMLSE